MTLGFSTTHAFSLQLILGETFVLFAGDATLGNGIGSVQTPAGSGTTAGCNSCASLFLGLVDPDIAFSQVTLAFDPAAPVSFEFDDPTVYVDDGSPPLPPIPLPGGLLLLGSALAGGVGLSALRRRQGQAFLI